MFRRLYTQPSSTTTSGSSRRKEEKARSEPRRLKPEIDLAEAGRKLDQLRKRKQLLKIRAEYTKIFDTEVERGLLYFVLFGVGSAILLISRGDLFLAWIVRPDWLTVKYPFF
jgi:hypothetical protein